MEKSPSSISAYKWQLLSFSHPALKRVFSTGINKVYSCVHTTLMRTCYPLLLENHLYNFFTSLITEIISTTSSAGPAQVLVPPDTEQKKISLSPISSPPVLFALISVWIVHLQQLWLWRGIHLFLLRFSAWPESSQGQIASLPLNFHLFFT